MNRTTPIQRTLSLVSALALLLTVFAVPAFAAGPAASATLALDDRLVTAGTNHAFDLTITNDEPEPDLLGQGGGESINWVVVTVSTAFADLSTDTFGAPQDWDVRWLNRRNNQVLFSTEFEDAELAPGASLDFSVNADVVRASQDKTGIFQIQVSSNGGGSTGPASASSSGALTSALRILEIASIRITAPSVNQTTVTNGQDNVTVSVAVTNHGSEPKTVAPELVDQGDADFEVTAAPDPQPVAADPTQTTTFDFGGVFSLTGDGDTEMVDLRAVIESADADAVTADGRELAVEVQREIGLAYLAGTLDPTVVAAGPKDISLSVEKTGVPSAQGLEIAATFTNGNDQVIPPLPADADVSGGGDVADLTFADVPFGADNLDEGDYVVALTATGTDSNGAAVAVSVAVGDTVFLDLTAPLLEIDAFEAPASRVDGEDDAATEGESFTLRGQVTDQGVGCGECTVTGTLRIGTAAAYDVDVPLNGNGEFDTTVPVDNAPEGQQNQAAVLRLTAVDATGDDNHRDAATASGLVDTRRPALEDTAPLTGGLAQFIDEDEDPSRIDVLFPEGVASNFDTHASNWSVQSDGGGDNLVTEAILRTADAVMDGTVGGITFGGGETLWFVQLTLNDELSGNADATVTYEPDSRTGVGVGEATGVTRVFDRVDLGLLMGSQETIDNIAPDLPVIDQVADKALQTDDDGEDKFFTGTSSNDVTVTSLEPGSTVELWYRPAGGTEADDVFVASTDGPISGNTYTFEDADLGTINTTIELFAVASDQGVKASTGEAITTVLDAVRPEVESATYDGDELIRLVTDEGMVGVDRAGDWYATATDEAGDPVTIFVNAVTKAPETESYDLRERDLDLDTSTYDPSEGGNADLVELFYDFIGSEGDQLADRAGNLFEREEPIAIATAGAGGGSGSGTEGSTTTNPVGRLIGTLAGTDG